MFSDPERDKTNLQHADNPEVGDYWSEMFLPVARVLQVEQTWVLVQKLTGQEGKAADAANPTPEVMTREAFAKWIRYETIPDKTWADVRPRLLANAA